MIEGIDVSSNQPHIDWQRVAAAGVQFVYVRASDGLGWTDPCFAKHVAGARAVGLPVGAYHYLRVRVGRDQDCVQQAIAFANLHETYVLELPPALDCEPDNNKGTLNADWAHCITYWCGEVTMRIGRKPFVYSYGPFLHTLGLPDDVTAYPLWLAKYSERMPEVPKPWSEIRMWQYAAGAGVLGTVDGVPGHVDRDRFFGSLEELRAMG